MTVIRFFYWPIIGFWPIFFAFNWATDMQWVEGYFIFVLLWVFVALMGNFRRKLGYSMPKYI